MAPVDAPTGDHPAADRLSKRKLQDGNPVKKRLARRKTGQAAPVARPECHFIAGQGSCPEWQGLLSQFPMIDSVQREDFPEHGASFAYLAHFYRTGNIAEENSCAQEEFEDFFRAIGYEYDYAGNFESRWFEGIGVKTR